MANEVMVAIVAVVFLDMEVGGKGGGGHLTLKVDVIRGVI